MVDIFQRIGRALEVRDIDVFDNENDDLEEPICCAHAHDNLFHLDNKSEELLPMPVFSCTKPTQGPSFLLHVLLSMGRFETEIDLTLHESVKACFCYAKLIGPNDDEESLRNYSSALIKIWITEQVRYYPNSKCVVIEWITVATNLFDKIIMENSLPMIEMPPV